MTEQTPAEKAIEVLRRELPGFEAAVHGPSDTIRIRTTLKLGAGMGIEHLYDVVIPVPDRYIEEKLAPLIRETRKKGIEVVNLEPMIQDREAAAEVRGRRHGYDAGRTKGRAEGFEAGQRRAFEKVGAALAGGLDGLIEMVQSAAIVEGEADS